MPEQDQAVAPAQPESKPAEYPKWIGAGHDGVVVNSKEEEDALLAKSKPKLAEEPKAPAVPPATP